MRSEEKMLAGELCHAGGAELQADAADAKAWMSRFNAGMAASADERRRLLRGPISAFGEEQGLTLASERICRRE